MGLVLWARTASETRRAGRRGRQFGVLVPMPVVAAGFEGDDEVPSALLLTGEYYQETDHANSLQVPRGWGVQASLLSVAPYAKIGWYGERGGVHFTNGVGIYGGVLGFFPRPEFLVWWPSMTVEVQPRSRLMTALHLGGSVRVDVDDLATDYQVMIGATLGFGFVD